ncbi:hypothetical protein D3C86_1707400 [compost metagenome]
MELKPKLCQMPDTVKMDRNHSGAIMKLILAMPIEAKNVFTIPSVGDRKLMIIPAMTTVEIKCGR